MHIRQGMFLEKKHGLDMGGVTHSDESICVVGVQRVKYRLLIPISGMQGSRG